MKTVLKYLKPFYLSMLLGFIIKVTGTVAELALPYILTHILQNVIYLKNVPKILFWSGLMVVFAAVAGVFNIIANRMAAKVSRDFSLDLRRDLFAKTLRLSAAQTDRFTVASLESRITTDTYNIHHFVGMMQRMGVRAPIMLLGSTVMALFMDFYLALVMVALTPFIFTIVFLISKKGIPLYKKVQKSVDRMIRVVREDAMGIRVIKALSKSEFEHKKYDEANSALSKDEQHAGIVMGSVHPIMDFLMNGGIAAVVAVSAFRISNGKSSPETVIAFMQYFTHISMAMMALTRMFSMCSKSIASAHRIEEVLEQTDELEKLPQSDSPEIKNDAFIEFDNVTFSYAGKKADIENISFSLKKGHRLGIIGATGSGKSTLIKLLLRFYDVGSGSIRINGRDIRTIDRKSLYAMFGTAMQSDFLYADTIAENIRFGREISDDDIKKAARIAQADGFICNFTEKYEHLLAQKAANISGGQKQRLLIARAVAAKPEILVLDDSSSALDYKTEASLRKALFENMKDTTVITVAQRVSAVKSCDIILMIDKGKIIGSGTHEMLMETCGKYREIAESQMGGMLLD